MASITVINHTDHMYRRTDKIEYIVLHYSASTRSSKGSAMQTVNTLDSRGFSSDYAVDDETIIQFADDPAKWRSTACQGWNINGTEAGKNSTNNNSVSIEMSSCLDKGAKWEANNPGFRFSQGVLDNTAYLCKMLIEKYKIEPQNIIRHFDIMGKACPGIIGWNLGKGSNSESEFRRFVDSLFDDTSFIPEDVDYDYSDYQDTPSYSGASNTSGSKSSNTVSQLAKAGSVGSENKQKNNGRKNEFEALRKKMNNDAPEMGRNIVETAELYDSNILK